MATNISSAKPDYAHRSSSKPSPNAYWPTIALRLSRLGCSKVFVPACGKKELYTHADNPWILRCGRLNHCAWEGHVKEIYTDLFEHWSNRFPSVEQHPHAAADAYLQYARGFDLKLIQGWYTQEHYYDAQRQIGSATVRFTVGDTFWERLIDQPERLSKKAKF